MADGDEKNESQVIVRCDYRRIYRLGVGSFDERCRCGSVVNGAAVISRTREHRVFFNRYQVPMMTLFIADADGKNEGPLHSRRELEYSPLFSADGQWIVFTKDQSGQADIFRVHSDGTGMEQLTDDPAFDDRGMPSPDGKTLAFVSTRHGGTANIWLMDLATRTSTKGAALLQPPIFLPERSYHARRRSPSLTFAVS